MASAKRKPEAAAQPKAQPVATPVDVPGVEESMPGLPGPAEQIPGGTEPKLEPVVQAPDAQELADARETIDAMKPIVETTERIKESMGKIVDTLSEWSASSSGERRYRVWPHGDLQRDGVTYRPGDELTLPVEVAQTIPCLVPVD